MSDGVMQFSLGLSASGFIRGIAEGSKALAAFSASAIGMGSLVDGVMSSIDKGAALEQLHRRTGASVAALFELQKGFQAAGLSGDDVSATLFQMQKSLGGVNEMGESTPDIFRKLGLSLDQLKQADAPHQINAIMQGLSKLDTSSAAAAAESIFGRQTAANMIQLSHSTKEFGDAMAESIDTAKNWQRIAPMLNQLHHGLEEIKSLGSGFFAGIAEGIGPALESGLKFIESFKSSLTSIGQSIGHIFSGVTEAFKEGKLGELLNLTFGASVEFMVNSIANTLGNGSFWGGIFDVMAGRFINAVSMMWEQFAMVGEAVIAGLDTAFQKMFEALGHTLIGKKIGLGGYKAETFSQNFTEEKRKGQAGMDVLDSMNGKGLSMMVQGAEKMAKAFHDGMANSGGVEQDKLKNFWSGLMKNTPGLPTSADTTPGTGNLSTEKYTYHKEFTGLEKMGFVGSGANPSQEYARGTMENTRQMCDLLNTTVSLLSGGVGQTNSI